MSKVFLVSVVGGGGGGAGEGGGAVVVDVPLVFVALWRSSRLFSQDRFSSGADHRNLRYLLQVSPRSLTAQSSPAFVKQNTRFNNVLWS